eukprot:9483087-Pyramimonas_sp.AAC.1
MASYITAVISTAESASFIVQRLLRRGATRMGAPRRAWAVPKWAGDACRRCQWGLRSELPVGPKGDPNRE